LRTNQIDSKTAILQALYTFPYLTADRVTTLLFSPGSLQGVRQHLKELADTNLVYREYLYSQARSKEYVYWLATSGRRKLRGLSADYDFTHWKQPRQMGVLLPSPHFRHFMTATDFLIQAVLIPQWYTDIDVLAATHYYHLRVPAPVVPDGLIKLVLPHGKQLTLLVEIDLHTESDERIKAKVRNYLWYITRGSFAKDYATNDVPIIVLYTPEETRRNKLLLLVEKALLENYEVAKSPWFRIGCGQLSPELLFEQIWVTPTGQQERTFTSLIAL
jgi:Replication-relaxation